MVVGSSLPFGVDEKSLHHSLPGGATRAANGANEAHEASMPVVEYAEFYALVAALVV